MLARWIRFALLALLALNVGCKSTALPNLLHPGPIEDQQAQTERAMSVADTDLFTAAPGILPPGYTPRAEVQQSRNVIPNPWFEQNQSYYRQVGPPAGVNRPGLLGIAGAPQPQTGAYPNGAAAPAAIGASNSPQSIPSFY